MVSEIGYQCFYQNSDIESVIIPKTITTIGDEAFYRCKNLTNIVLPEGIKEIYDKAFISCAIKDVVLPESLIEVGEQAFAYNYAMKKASIKGKTEFGIGTFMYCESLESVEFHNAISTLPREMLSLIHI